MEESNENQIELSKLKKKPKRYIYGKIKKFSKEETVIISKKQLDKLRRKNAVAKRILINLKDTLVNFDQLFNVISDINEKIDLISDEDGNFIDDPNVKYELSDDYESENSSLGSLYSYTSLGTLDSKEEIYSQNGYEPAD